MKQIILAIGVTLALIFWASLAEDRGGVLVIAVIVGLAVIIWLLQKLPGGGSRHRDR